MKNLYSSSLREELFDVVVIGSGIGGLSSAVCLAKAKKKVLVLERHYMPGGFSHSFKRKKFEWDVGVHYVGRMEDKNSLMRRAFDYVTDGKLKWTGMGEVYDKAVIAGDEYDFVAGVENQIKRMIAYFPKEEKAIRTYYKLVCSLGAHSTAFFSERSMPPWLSRIFGRLMKKGFHRYASRTTYEVLTELTNNEKLISVLCAQCGNYGLPPRKSSFAIHAIVVDHYLEGGSYPVGGSSSIHRCMIETLEKNGGRIAIKAEVKRIIIENGCAVGVEMKNGDCIRANQVISNAGVHNTFNDLLSGEEHSEAACHSFNQIKSSIAHVCLYLGLDGTDEELKLPRHNYWLYPKYGFDEGMESHLLNPGSSLPLVYISFPSAKDPSWDKGHPGTSTIQVMAPCPYEWVKEWECSRWQHRGEGYDSFKEGYVSELLEKLFEVLPQTRGRIISQELSTPLSTKHFSNYGQGEIYGMEHTPLRYSNNNLRAQTGYKNLFLAGQDVVTVGVGAALFSGVLASTRILSRNMLWRIQRYKPSENI
jgi:all-trans-retinol 13,14-reductase